MTQVLSIAERDVGNTDTLPDMIAELAEVDRAYLDLERKVDAARASGDSKYDCPLNPDPWQEIVARQCDLRSQLEGTPTTQPRGMRAKFEACFLPGDRAGVLAGNEVLPGGMTASIYRDLIEMTEQQARAEDEDSAVALGRELSAAHKSVRFFDRQRSNGDGQLQSAHQRMWDLMKQTETVQARTLVGALVHVVAAGDNLAHLCDDLDSMEPSEVQQLADRTLVQLWRICHAIEAHTDARIEDFGGEFCMPRQYDPTRSEPMPAVETPAQEAAE